MVLAVPINTYTALQNATRDGLIVRYGIWIGGKNRSTGAIEYFGIWSGDVAQTFPVTRNSDGSTVNRVYQPGAGQFTPPSIPMSMTLEVASIRVEFGALAPAVYNAVKVYNPRRQTFQIHVFFFDRNMNLIDPGFCLWDGRVQRIKGKRDKVGGPRKIEIEAGGHSMMLTRKNAQKMSSDFFEKRGDKSGRYVASIWRVAIPWGANKIENDPKIPKQKYFNK